jgi:hypothetical protein
VTVDPLHFFEEVRFADFEFNAQAGERPSPVCLVVRELRSGRIFRYWLDELRLMKQPPFPTDAANLVRGVLRFRRVGLLSGARLAHARPCA